jgi:ribonucleoside-diphosphate reductase alpha chain
LTVDRNNLSKVKSQKSKVKVFRSIRKRNGQIAPFKIEKITNAIYKASVAVGEPNWKLAENFGREVVKRLEKKIYRSNRSNRTYRTYRTYIPTVEEVQDVVEQVLIEKVHPKIAKAYILYRQHRAEIRQEKKQILNKTEVDEVDKKFDINALRVLASRYLKKDEIGKVMESPKELFERVSAHTTLPSLFYDPKVFQKRGGAAEHRFEEFDPKKFEGKFSIGKYKLNQFHLEALKRLYDRFAKERKIKVSWSAFLNLFKKGYFDKYESEIDTYYNLMVDRRFLPNTPALANFGSYLGMGSACFTLGIEDSIDSIMDTLKAAAIIFKSGGGVGYNFSHLRPEGDFVKTTGGAASGPISFMSMFDNMTEVIKQGGCVANDSLIRTDKGLMKIEELLNAPEFRGNQTRHFVYDGKDYHHAFLAMNNGSAEVYEIKTDLGNKLKSTYNHLITVVNPQTGNLVWQKVSELKKGDWAIAVLGGHFGKDILLPRLELKQHYNSRPLKIPEYLNEELAEMLGIYMADGCISKGRFIFSVDEKDEDLAGRVIDLMRRNFGLELGSRWKKPGQKYIDLIFYSKDLERCFEKMGWKKDGAKNAFIPREIFLSKPRTAQSFLRGLFEGDGTVHPDGYPLLISISERLISETQQLLLGLGMVAKIRKKSVANIKDRKGKNDLYVLIVLTDRSIKKFKKEIGFISKRKNRNLNRYFRQKAIEYSDLIPYSPEIFKKYYQWVGRGSGLKRGKKGANSVYYRAVQRYIKGDRQLTRKTFEKLMEKFEFLKNDETVKNLSEDQYFFTKIASIKEKENEKTMEIEVPASGSYVANGFLVHNIRRGANMGILNSNHPDIENFVKAKEGNKALRNFNISIMIMSGFWEAYRENKPYALINPRNGKVTAEIDSRKLFDAIAYQVWESAEPGILFFDRINEYNPFLKGLGPIESTNPCSEVLLYPFESCNLGSLNVWNYLKKNGDKKPQFDWQKLEQDVKIATRFLDNVVDVNKYPLGEIEEMTLNTRKIGLGVMGVGDLLCEVEISYASRQSLEFMERLMESVNYFSKVASVELSKERGRMPYFDKSFYREGRMPFAGFKDKKSWHFDWAEIARKIKKYGIRNGFTTVIAPTGSISMIAGTSSGIEPIYSLVFEKNVAIGSFYYVDPVFEEAMRKAGLMDEALIKDTARLNGSIKHINYIPEKYKKTFVTAMDISPPDHVRVLAAFQKWVDSAISKTNNFPAEAAVEDIKRVYLLAYELGCKGVTVYRDKSLHTQVLVGGSTKKKPKDIQRLSLVKKDEKTKGLVVYHEAGAKTGAPNLELSPADAPDDNPGNSENEIKFCPACKTALAIQGGCRKCPSCGWGMCS